MPTMITGASCIISAWRPRSVFCAPWDAKWTIRPPCRSSSRHWRSLAGRTLLPPVAAANGKRIGIDLNIPARDFGASLVWSVNLEDGGRRNGVMSTARLPGSLARRSGGLLDHPAPFRVAAGAAAGIPRAGRENRRRRRQPLLARSSRRPSATSPIRRAGACGAWRCSFTRCAPATTGESVILAISKP